MIVIEQYATLLVTYIFQIDFDSNRFKRNRAVNDKVHTSITHK